MTRAEAQALRTAIEDMKHRMKEWVFDANMVALDRQASPSMQKAAEKYKKRAEAIAVIEGMLAQKRMEI